MTASPVLRYHPLLVLLHWVIAVLLIATLCIGFVQLAPMSNHDPQKIRLLLIHMSLGMSILVLMLIRLALRMWMVRPVAAATGHPALDRVARLAHSGFYLVVVLMAGTGLATAVLAGLNRSVFQSSGDPLPANFASYPTFVAHLSLALLLSALIALHLIATVYHHFARKDRLLRRMWFGQRNASNCFRALKSVRSGQNASNPGIGQPLN